MMELRSLSVGVFSTSAPVVRAQADVPPSSRLYDNASHLRPSVASDGRMNPCERWAPLRLRRNSVHSFECRNAAEAQSRSPIDVEATVSAVAGDEDDDYPLWMEEDDPNWPEYDPNGDGVGFKVDDFFQPKVMNVPNEDGSTDEDAPDINWEVEQYQWIVKKITSAKCGTVARDDPTSLIFYAFERYGPSGSECWKLLEELEKLVRIIVESRRYPIRVSFLPLSLRWHRD